MPKLDPWRTGTALAVTVVIGYAICAVIFVAFPDASANFMNSLFHGLDFRKLQPAAGRFSLAGFGVAAVVMAGWAFVVGAIFASVSNLLGR
ncbi:MAG TPA: DUF5676 family membrane protein [Burkholderiales bacterium]|nr:DUF5676 family membrane protein [Burkholderiales bacterium]